MSSLTFGKFLQSSSRRFSPVRIQARSLVYVQQAHLSRSRPHLPSQCPIQSKGRLLSTSQARGKGLIPESADPKPRNAEPTATKASGPAEITVDQFHEVSDLYLNSLVEKLEQLQEERDEVDCEYTSGVLTLAFPPNGTYVINKQPPNKQIWLSSPLTGPKRYDYVLLDEGQDSKEGSGRGEWVYLRDHSTLTNLLKEEIGVDMAGIHEGSL